MTPPDVRARNWGAQLSWAEQTLAGAGSPTPRRDALMLLMNLVHAPRSLLLAHPERTLDPAEITRYAGWVSRRARGEPVAYITGRQAFMGLDLQVDRRSALVRPSTASVIEVALECLRSRPPAERELLVAEVGTGCGAIALALGLFEPRIAHIYAVDPSAEALEVARANGERYLLNLFVSWLMGEGLDPIPEPVDLIIANRSDRSSRRAERDMATPADLPGRWADMARYEPHPEGWSAEENAEENAEDEMARLSRLIGQAPAKLRPGGTLICALEDAQRAPVAGLLAELLAQAHVWFSSSPAGQVGEAGSDGLVVAHWPR
jgi:release factor glutamine methyltransferase